MPLPKRLDKITIKIDAAEHLVPTIEGVIRNILPKAEFAEIGRAHV